MRPVKEDRIDWLSVALVVVLHILVVLTLWLVRLNRPERQEESGVPVMIGDMGNLNTDYDLTEVDTYSAPVTPVPAADVQAPSLVTQNLEETVEIESGQEKVDKPQEAPQPTEEELRAQEEQRVRDEANRLMQNLFGQSGASTSSPEDNTRKAEGVAGTPDGNATQGKSSGTGAFGNYDLGGRSVDGNGLQRPSYTVQEEGRVVVTITVNPSGEVIATSINKRTNTMNAQLRAAAEDAARRTRFNSVDGPDNQTGTITYYFQLK